MDFTHQPARASDATLKGWFGPAVIDKQDPTCVPPHACPCLSLPDILLPSTTSDVSFSLKVLARLPAELLRKLTGKEVMLVGDGRHDSMGYSAKYGTCTIFCCTTRYFIIYIVLVQVTFQ